MTSAEVQSSGLSRSQRRLVLGAALPVLATYCVTASVNYLMDPLVEQVGLAADAVTTALQLPSLAAILVVFSAGALGDRLGRRRVMAFGGSVFVLGCLLVAVAPGMLVVSLGLMLAGVGASAVSIVALALVSAGIAEPAARASAFAVFAALGPVAFLVMPLVAGALVEAATWRLVPALWVALGGAGVAATMRLLPAGEPSSESGDLVTPLLLGVAVTAFAQWVTWTADSGFTGAAGTGRAGRFAAGAGGDRADVPEGAPQVPRARPAAARTDARPAPA